MKENGPNLRFVVLAALAAYILLSHAPSLIHPILDIDEADFAVQTAVWLDGGVPYVDFVEKKPPIIQAAYATAFLIGGPWNMAAVHVLFALMSVATGLILMRVAERAGGATVAVPALALFAAYQAGYDANDFLMAGTEIPMNLAAAAAAYFAIAALDGERRRLPLFASGFFTALAALAKPVAVAFLPAVLAAGLVARIREKKAKAVASDAAAFLSGFALPFAVLAAALAHAGALDDAIRWVWTENVAYAEASVPLSERLTHGATRISLYLLASLPLWVLAAGRIVSSFRRREFTETDALCTAWLLASFWTVSLGWRFFPHYFMQFIPPLVILATLGWSSWLSPMLAGRGKLKVAALLMGIAAPMAVFPTIQTFQARVIAEKSNVEQTIAGEVSAMTGAGDRIFVWGHSSDVYFYSRRLPSSRFVYCSFLTGAAEGFEDANAMGGGSDDAWRMLMKDLASRPPSLVIDMSGTGIRGYGAYPLTAFPYLRALLEREYRPAKEISGATIFEKIAR